LLKPCKVKRFLATEDLSVVGLVTGSSGNEGLRWRKRKREVCNHGKINVRGRERERRRNHDNEGDEEKKISEGFTLRGAAQPQLTNTFHL